METSFTEGVLNYFGILAAANLDDCKIKIRENGKRKYKVVLVPKDKIGNISRSFFQQFSLLESF